MTYKYVHGAKWFEQNTPKCKNCRSNMQTVFQSRTHKDKPVETCVCPMCGKTKVKTNKD